MIKKLDTQSEEFQTNLELTIQFTNKVCEQFNFVYNPEYDVNESVQQGLTRNKIIYGKRFCPCFAVIGETKEEQKKADNRICPCKPALETEIPTDGKCRCGIFCTPDYAENKILETEAKEIAHNHSRILNFQECKLLLEKDEIDSSELEALLEARESNIIQFSLVDVREWMEWRGARIKGCDHLVPTTSFYQTLSVIENQKEKPVVVYCHIGSRSAYCQRVMKDMGFKSVSNLSNGIVAFQGEIISGDK